MKVVVISGGTTGIGLACGYKFLENGCFVYNLDIVEPNIDELYNNYKWIKTDVTERFAIENAIKIIRNQHKKIDIIIISAGKHLSANIENTSDKQLNDILNLNLKGAFWLVQEIIPHMKKEKYGVIITIGSDQSSVAKRNSTIYGMTKSALLSLTKSIALDYAKYNIRANCIGAGTVDTPLYQNAITEYANKSGISINQVNSEEANSQPIGRIGKPEEIAKLAYFLCQDIASYITGAIIPIDGGYTTQ